MTTRILICLFMVMIAGLISSNIILKKQYDALDKSDIYWTYNRIMTQPFKYLNITGGNGTRIYYEQSDKPSVRLLQEWVHYHRGEVKAVVKNDTLYLNFDYEAANPYEKNYLENAVPVRIFSPELLSVTGHNTNFEMQKLKQRSINVHISGKSKFEAESMYPDLDTVNVNQSDSSAVVFEMSPDYRKQPGDKAEFPHTKDILVKDKRGDQRNFDESMSIKSLHAILNGHSILDVGHAQIKNIDLNVSDSSAIVLSGNALQILKK